MNGHLDLKSQRVARFSETAAEKRGKYRRGGSGRRESLHVVKG